MLVSLLIASLLVAGAAGIVGGGFILANGRRKRLGTSEGPKLLGSGEPQLERGPEDLRAGDIIQYRSTDFLVEGIVHYDEDGHRWLVGRLVDGRDVRWLIVGMDRAGLGLFRMTEQIEPPFSGEYPPDAMRQKDTRFILEKRGNATARVIGDVGGLGRGSAGSVVRCRWWRYEAAGSSCLLVEQWGSDFRALQGETVAPGELEMIPGS